ncbi:lantibiotic dehydratase [Chitinophaga sp. Hz27]|uniref:lantibiotic dehydratase n=1 Tax=Chitinophaga sp. Hz27 TaxID=3347169 RepID=UPI0035DDCEE8
MDIPYLFDQRLVLRTPRFPLTEQVNRIDFTTLLQDNAFLEALYLASPVLHDECIKWREGLITNKKDIDKLVRSVSKYYLRMSSRCTPFGLFSGCAVVEWSKEGTSIVVSDKNIDRHTRLDMHYLCALAQRLAKLPGIKENLRYFPNNSIYSIGDELRYVEYTYKNGKRRHQISAVTGAETVTRVLRSATNGATMKEMVGWLTDGEITTEEATVFIEQLMEAQLLVNELEPAITGKEFLFQIIAVLDNIDQQQESIQKILPVLRQIGTLLKELDKTAGNNVTLYRDIMQILDLLGVKYEENKLFQTDTVKLVSGKGVDESIQEKLTAGLEALNKLTIAKPNEHLQSFTRRFYERYEDKEMPLLEVLDIETGIGYLDNGGGSIMPLIRGMHSVEKTRDKNIPWGKLETMLHNKLMDAYARKSNIVEFQDEDLAKLNANWNDLPPSISVMFRLIDNQDNVFIESVYGSSAANLLGRFAHADERINEMVCDITNQEQAQDPDIVYAEIIHLPESRAGNVLLHPVFRNYEIPYLAKSSLDKANQIDVQDLYVSVRNNKVILRSGRLNKRVIPRLTTAHNFSIDALPVYQFLGDLQLQDRRSQLVFNWGNLQTQHRCLPRAIYKNTILHLARWSFTWSEVKHLAELENESLSAAVKKFRDEWNLPQCMVLADGDNELLVDFESPSMLAVLLDTVKNRPVFMLREFLNDQQLVTNGNGDAYVNQIVAVLKKTAPSHANATTLKQKQSSEQIPEKFTLGSEWLYYKLYCGLKSADKILEEAIKPLTEELQARGITDKWFFIRYTDPGFHIRLRFHLPDVQKTGDVINLVRTYLEPYQEDGYIWKMQTDTYARETDRYGANTISLAETFFYHDSKALLEMLYNTYGDEREELRWMWGMRSIEELLVVFKLSLAEKLALLDHLKDVFATEFNVDKTIKLQLNDRYRNNKKRIDLIMNKELSPENDIYPLIEILNNKSQAIQPLAEEILMLKESGRLKVSLPDLLSSYIHMILNRIIPSNPRKHEMVIYDFLSRYYQSAIARQKATAI